MFFSRMTLPNKITLLRLPLTALFFVFFFDQPLPWIFPDLQSTRWHYSLAFVFFILACASDWVDGYLARKLNQTSIFGKLWDPIADKILVTAAWVMFVAAHTMPAWMAVVLLSRDFAVNGLRMTAAQQNLVLSAETGGKIKTIIHLVTIGAVCFHQALGHDFKMQWIVSYWVWVEDWILFPLSVVSSVWSAWSYFHKNWALLKMS